MEDALEMWTIYQRPRDYPCGYVVRRSIIGAGIVRADKVAIYVKDIHEARAMIPAGKVCLPPDEGDDPVILETWL